MSLPKVVLTSVIRAAHQGHSHGGVYLADLATGATSQVIDWNDGTISWEGRGADRGLRGIAFHGEEIYLAASDEVFVYDPRFRLLRSFRNAYLRHCHEIAIGGGRLYLTSTGFDAVLEYDLGARRFVRGYSFRAGWAARALRALGVAGRFDGFGLAAPVRVRRFDPERPGGPAPGDTRHVNMVSLRDETLYVAGTNMTRLLAVRDEGVRSHAAIPEGSHNAAPFGAKVLLNNTRTDEVAVLDCKGKVEAAFPVPRYPESALENTALAGGTARQAFARGLAVHGELLIGGSSPATVAVHSLAERRTERSINLTMDVRNAVHGLEVWPYA